MNTPARILIVDDDVVNALVLVRALEKAGYEVLQANDGFVAVEYATEREPDLILLDVMMPQRSGLEVCTILKGQQNTAAIPIIFITAVTDSEQTLQAFAVGGCDYVTKPYRLDEVLARVSVHVRLRQAEEELIEKHEELAHLADQLSEANDELQVLSRVDPLTGLLNRRTWEQAASTEHKRATRHGHAYSIVMLDVDFFKLFNDTQGHQAGDDCLQQVAGAIEHACRDHDSVGRYGGEEFVVLAPETDAGAAMKLADRIRRAVWALGIDHPIHAGAGRVTISAGLASSGELHGWEAVLKQADDALYVAKRAGRNMVYGGKHSPPVLAAAKTPAPAGAPGQVNVLVVDDEPANRAVCRASLVREGYRVLEAEDGHAALRSVFDDPPDVIVMDVMMPDMDGLECTRRLRAHPDTRDIPVVMVSALAKEADILAGLEAGADEYLTKPIRITELALRVRSMARLRRERADLLLSHSLRGEHVRILMRLVELCRLVGVSATVDEALRYTGEAVADVVHAQRVSLMVPDEGGKRLRVAYASGMDQELAAAVRVPVGAGVAGQVFATGKSLVVNAEGERPEPTEAYDSEFFASVPLLCAPLDAGDRVLAVLNVTERVGGIPFDAHELEYIELIAKVAAGALQTISSRTAHEQACDSIMLGLAKLAEHRDNDTGLHLDRVTQYCLLLANDLSAHGYCADEITPAFLHDLERAVPLHDIGKVAIPDDILLHPGRLDEQQLSVMRLHATLGANTIRTLIERTPGVEFLEMAAQIAHHHHERWDGTGYPSRLAARDIPLAARIVAVADVYDALTTKRVYKDAMSHEQARSIIGEGAGTQFDPRGCRGVHAAGGAVRRAGEGPGGRLHRPGAVGGGPGGGAGGRAGARDRACPRLRLRGGQSHSLERHQGDRWVGRRASARATTIALDHAHWKLKPPMRPSTSRISPAR